MRLPLPVKGLTGSATCRMHGRCHTHTFLSARQGFGKGLPVHPPMSFLTAVYAVWISVHLLGLTAAWLVRTKSGRRGEGLAQLGFLACLPLIAMATVVGQHLCLAFWPLSAGTLAVMIVMAIADFGPRSSALAVLEARN